MFDQSAGRTSLAVPTLLGIATTLAFLLPRHTMTGSPFVVRVIDADGSGVAGAAVSVWRHEAPHPFAKELERGHANYLARFVPGLQGDAAEKVWSHFIGTDPTWAEPDLRGTTDETGRCALGLPDGTLFIAASHSELGSSRTWTGTPAQLLAGPDGGPPFELLLELEPSFTVSGQVMNTDDEPVEGAIVCARVGTRPIRDFVLRCPPAARTGADGRFTMQFATPCFATFVALSGDRWSTQDHASAPIGRRDSISLRFGSAGTVAGIVLSPYATAVAGAKVIARGPGGVSEATVTRDDGTFTLAVSAPGNWLVGAAADPWLPKEAIEIDIMPFGTSDDMTLELVEPAKIHGRVLWKTGGPAAGLTIETMSGMGDQSSVRNVVGLLPLVPSAISDYEGRFEIGPVHPKCSYSLSVSPAADRPSTFSGTHVKPGDSPELAVDEESMQPHSLSGRVIDAESGEAIPEFTLSLSNTFPVGTQLSSPAGDTHRFRSADGGFRIADVAGTALYLRVIAAGHVARTIGPLSPVGQADPIEVRLGHVAQLITPVVDEQGRPVPGATVLLRNPPTEQRELLELGTRSMTTDVNGRATWSRLLPETYALQAFEGARRSPITTAALPSGGSTTLELKLDPTLPGGSLHVSVVDANSTSVAGAEVRLQWMAPYSPEHEVESPRLNQALSTNELGDATFGCVPSGRYFLLGGDWPQSDTTFVQIEDGKTADVVLRLGE